MFNAAYARRPKTGQTQTTSAQKPTSTKQPVQHVVALHLLFSGQMGSHRPLTWLSGCVLLLILLISCSTVPSLPVASNASSRTSTPTTASSLSLSAPGPGPAGSGAPGCHPPSPVDSLAEIRGTATGAQLWALLFASQPIHPRQEIKIVWRMTGTGTFSISTRGPQGKHAQLTFGPEVHGGSNWKRPGDEWGTGFTFPLAGCWNLHATRGSASGDVWLVVQAS